MVQVKIEVDRDLAFNFEVDMRRRVGGFLVFLLARQPLGRRLIVSALEFALFPISAFTIASNTPKTNLSPLCWFIFGVLIFFKLLVGFNSTVQMLHLKHDGRTRIWVVKDRTISRRMVFFFYIIYFLSFFSLHFRLSLKRSTSNVTTLDCVIFKLFSFGY